MPRRTRPRKLENSQSASRRVSSFLLLYNLLISIYSVPVEGLEPPTVSIGRNWIASIESELLVCMPCCSKRAARARTDSGDKRNG